MDKYLTRERLLAVRNHRHFNLWATILVILLVLDLLFLNLKILFPNNTIVERIFQERSNPTSSIQNPATKSDSCGQTCMAEINKAISAALSVEKSSTTVKSVAAPAGAQEYFIPLGAGAISSTTLQTISGMQATIDGSAYGNIKTTTFEITVSVPTGNETADFQLYNSTANHPVWNSSVNFSSGGTPQLLISSPITLDPGSNTYVVQGSTQLQFPANITQARVHIISQ